MATKDSNTTWHKAAASEKADLKTRLLNFTSPEPNTGCWLWLGAIGDKGYGSFTVSGRSRGAHRVMYQLSVGPIPEGLVIDHLCRTRCCVNPQHMEPVMSRENSIRGIGWAGTNSRKTHCPKGHDDLGSIGRKKGRECRECHRIRARKVTAAKRDAAFRANLDRLMGEKE